MFIKDILLGLKVMNWKVSKGIKDTRLPMGIKVNGKEKKGGEEKKKEEGRKKGKGEKEGKKEKKVLLGFLMLTLISEKKQRWRGVVTVMTIWSIYQAIYSVEVVQPSPLFCIV